MDNITERIAKVTDLSTYTDLTPEHLKKLFLEIGGSPEKLRTILNLWFVPDFKPTFTEPQDYSFGGLQDVGFLESPDTESPQRPLRLIDLETGNLVDVWNTSPSDSYCMLSHRWKGDEITLAHIKRARQKHLERSRDGMLSEFDGDIHIVLEQSRLDILEQEQMIESLLGGNPDGRTIADLLQMRIAASDAKSQVNRARQNRDAKKSKVERCMMEKDMFDHLMNRIQKDISEDTEQVADPKPTASPLVDEAEAEYAEAQKSLEVSITNQNKANQDAEFFGSDRRLGDAVDEMMSRLQRWKSAIKLGRSMSEARDIFQTNMFPNHGARYIWSDTCCIDKLNYGELSQSLSLMGDWYANAEFCLVHLDTDCRAADAIHDWKQFKGDPVNNSPNIPSFKAIEGTTPEWSKRAWTLQELVMSKMAYFTNSQWTSLSRPVESLGYIYPLIPFIDLYTRGDIADVYSNGNETNAVEGIRNSATLGSLVAVDEVIIASYDGEDQSASESVSTAVRIASILQTLGFIFPREMTTETALPEISRAVYLAAHNLVRYESDNASSPMRDILAEVNHHIPTATKTEGLGAEIEAQNAINFLLYSLVTTTKDLVLEDRRSIASFGQVNQLDSWKQGIARSGFSAQRVLQLSCSRNATVPVDHVYSLMGILGVRFQSFHAEGYAKALSRLLDEVIISHNDVSVFNWTGAFMGSPVRGRSMYPASHKAYSNEEDSGRRYNMMISAEVQRQRKDVMVAYQGIITMLRDAIDCIKDKGREGLPLDWVRDICVFVKASTFEVLGPELENIGKILRYIQDHCVKPDPAPPTPSAQQQIPVVQSPPPVPDAKSGAGAGWGFNKPTLPSMKVGASLKTPKLPGFGGTSITKPSFGRHHSEPVEKAVVPEPVSPPKPTAPEVPEWLSLDQEVKTYLESLTSNTETKGRLPTRIQELETKRPASEAKIERTNTGYTSLDDDLTCPNPIIINSSGIEGIFDIQRIVVTMIDREKLARQVAKASSPKQKISGWCIISTGFASVVVNFACEQHMLKKQLDVEQTVEDKIIKEDRARKLHSTLQIVAGKPNDNGAPTTKEAQSNDTEDPTGKNINSSKPTKDELAIVRIIDFIQEPQLQLVAGEWVLARFSGTPGTQWFLCYLELGSTHSYYGHRISASDINFNNSAIEPGLMKAWKVYMNRKKSKMCNVLDKYIKSSTSAMKGKERLNKSSEIANENYARFMDAGNQSLERVMSMGSSVSVSPSMLKLPFTESDAKEVGAKDLDSDDDEDGGKGLFDGLLDQGKEATAALGEYTVLAAYEKICEMHAQHLDKHLTTSVLKRTPKSLQTAVESVDENKGFLPAMFHSSRRVHMF
ncbi:hypothetical protein NW752_007984 [Fusarium irregulare]|uniref:Heterokaryon incompatibility domain-containing protein n=1 Tax=Fusarium irregulare TaxID=2494466 RepID=A0A9W8UDG8_9HYPO|nr:hypothetical protein NW752_007984 [Fusarium irregulare]KAJ4019742.1 hypothetical protein NW766_003500 [Fusarium irregulare]